MNDTGSKAQQALETELQARSAWRTTSAALLLAMLATAVVFYPTIESIVSIWIRSETFTHGFIILPISLWLIWQKRELLQPMAPYPSLLALVPLTGAGFLWLLGSLVDVLVVQQVAFVLILIFSVWGIVGNQVGCKLVFPLFFLLFMVPVGEGLVPPMMEITANTTVWLVRATGIPVYREGLFFSLPSGNWSVVEACSGVRYLIASITLGCLYAYLTYRTLWKRMVFVAISAVVPIAANSARAYIIVMLGHMSDMKIATGVDHLIYGWVFFGLVMLILFWIGGFFREDHLHANITDDTFPPDSEVPGAFSERLLSDSNNNIANSNKSIAKFFARYMPVFLAALCWPILASTFFTSKPVENYPGLIPPEAAQDWRLLAEPSSDWRPIVAGSTVSLHSTYASAEGQKVGLYVYHYLHQEQGAELINSLNQLTGDRSSWRTISRGSLTIDLDGRQVAVDTAVLRGPQEIIRVWSWYRIGNFYTSNNYIAKVMEALNMLVGSRQDGARIFLVTENAEASDLDDIRLQELIEQLISGLEQSLDRNAGV